MLCISKIVLDFCQTWESRIEIQMSFSTYTYLGLEVLQNYRGPCKMMGFIVLSTFS